MHVVSIERLKYDELADTVCGLVVRTPCFPPGGLGSTLGIDDADSKPPKLKHE